MKNIVGSAVFGEDFFPRPREIRKIQYVLQNKGHPLIIAPRRIGKTSILLELLEQAPNSPHHFIWLVVQAVESEEEYFNRLYNVLLQSDGTDTMVKMSRRTREFLGNLMGRLKSIKGPGRTQIDLRMSPKKPALEKFSNLLSNLPLSPTEKLIIMIDEFPDSVKAISEKHGKERAVNFLKVNRELRQSLSPRGKVQFIYTGSIGLNQVVSELGRHDLINDLTAVEINALKPAEGIEMIGRLLQEAPITMSHQHIETMVNRVRYLVPYFLQVWFYELVQTSFNRDILKADKNLIEAAFEAMIARDEYFTHWRSRLGRILKEGKYRFAMELLDGIASGGTFDGGRIFDLAMKHKVQEEYHTTLKLLTDDGYLVSELGILHFLSPVLKAWWGRHATIKR